MGSSDAPVPLVGQPNTQQSSSSPCFQARPSIRDLRPSLAPIASNELPVPTYWICCTCDSIHHVRRLFAARQKKRCSCSKPVMNAMYDQSGSCCFWDPRETYDLSDACVQDDVAMKALLMMGWDEEEDERALEVDMEVESGLSIKVNMALDSTCHDAHLYESDSSNTPNDFHARQPASTTRIPE